MTSAHNDNQDHDEATAFCFAALQRLGRAYGKAIMHAVISAGLGPDQIDAGIDAALGDTEDWLRSSGICEFDVEQSIAVVRAAIIAEGKALAVLLDAKTEGGLH